MRNWLIALALILVSPTGSFAQTAPDPSTATATPTAVTTQTPTPATTETPTPTPLTTDTPTPTAVTTQTPAPATTDTQTPVPSVAPSPFVSGVPCATDDPSNERVQRSERHGDDEDGRGNHDEFRTGNGTNSAIVHNCTDNRLRVRAAIQLNTIPGHVVDPLNQAYAESTCTGCSTLAVALQINLYSSDRADDIQPQNYAVAVNTACTSCVTVADAYQYVQGEEDPREVSQDISDTVEQLADELAAIQNDPSVSLPDAEARINNVIARFQVLGGSLDQQRDEHDS